MNYGKHFVFVLLGVIFLLAPTFGEGGGALSSMLDKEAPFYENYGDEAYSRQEIKADISSYYDRFGTFITKGYSVYGLYNGKEKLGLTEDKSFDSTASAISQEKAYKRFFDNFSNLVYTRDAIGGTKSTFLVGDRIETRFTPFTFNKLNYKGIRWDMWTKGIKITGLISRTRPGAAAMSGRDIMAPVTYPLIDGSFVDTSHEWKTLDNMEKSPLSVDYSNKSVYGDYDFFWAAHVENTIGRNFRYGLTYMNHHHSDIEKGEKLRGDIPDGLVPNEIHFEFYDITPRRTDDAGCYLEKITMKVNGVNAGGPTGVYIVDVIDSAFASISIPYVQNGWAPIVTTFYPANPTIPHGFEKEDIKHVTFDYSVGGNYLVFVSTDRFIPLSMTATIEENPRVVSYNDPHTVSIEDIVGRDLVVGNSEATSYFGDYIAKAPKYSNVYINSRQSPVSIANYRSYTYEFTIDVNSVTYGANFEGKYFGINFSGEIATNTREGKYPGSKNGVGEYGSEKVRRNVMQLKADRSFNGDMFNLSGELYSVSPNWETNLKIPQASRFISRTRYTRSGAKDPGYDYNVYPKPLSNDWRTVDDNEDGDVYVENNRRPYPSDKGQTEYSSFNFDGTIASAVAETLFLPTGMNILYDDKDGVIPDLYDRNKNGTVDYREDFLLFYTDPPVFELGNDMDFNGVYDYEDDDLVPDYPYKLPYTLTSNAYITHGLQGFSTKLAINYNRFKFNVGAKVEKAISMNATSNPTEDDVPGVDEGKSSLLFGDFMMRVLNRDAGLDYYIGNELYFVKDAIRNDVVKTEADMNNLDENGIIFRFITDPLRYRNAIVNNFVSGLLYTDIPNFEINTRLMLGLEKHNAIDDTFFVTKTMPDYTYRSFWEPYPDRIIAKTYFINKVGYTQKFNLDMGGWKSVFNVLNRFSIESQYKLSYEFKKNLKEKDVEKDPRKKPEYANLNTLTKGGIVDFQNEWQEYSQNTTDLLLSVPIVRLNFKIAERTMLQAGVQWMRSVDRMVETESFYKVKKVAQIISQDNYQGYNVAIVVGFDTWSQKWDINYHDSILNTGRDFNLSYSKVFAEIYAGL